MLDIQSPSYFINPAFHPSKGKGIGVENPATLENVGTRAVVTETELNETLSQVTAAQAKWKTVDAKSRAATLHALANTIETADLTNCAMIMTREMGKPYPEAIGELAAKQYPELAGKLLGLLGDKRLRIAAIRAMAAYEQDALADELLKRYDKFSADERAVVVQTLASRPKSGWKLALAIKSERVPRADIPAYIARQLRRVAGSGFVEIWGPIDELSSDLDAAFTKYRALFTDAAIGASDLSHGRQIYQRTCFACHKMYGGGGEIGPELTGSNRADLNYILDNILNPSGEIPEGYQMVVVTTRDGRTYTGNLASETKRQLTLRLIGAEPVAIDKADIQSREIHPISLMPAGLLSTLKDDEAIALIAYLRTTKQVPIKE